MLIHSITIYATETFFFFNLSSQGPSHVDLFYHSWPSFHYFQTCFPGSSHVDSLFTNEQHAHFCHTYLPYDLRLGKMAALLAKTQTSGHYFHMLIFN